jgi:hypothetical protein
LLVEGLSIPDLPIAPGNHRGGAPAGNATPK